MAITVSKQRLDYVMNQLRHPYTGKPLHDYQKEGILYLLKHWKAIVADDKGLGKTVQILCVMYLLDVKDCTILCGQSALSTWGKELKLWFPDWDVSLTIVEGQPHRREKLWKEKTDIKVSTYKTYQMDFPKGWAPKYSTVRIYDEIKVRNRKTQIFKMLNQLKGMFVFPTTGSPVRKGSQDYWTLMQLVNPTLFPSYWKFINTFCDIEDGFFGQEIVGMKNTEQLRQLMSGNLIMRSKKDPEIAKQLPPLTRDFIDIYLEPKMKAVYEELQEKMIVDLPTKIFTMRTILDSTIRCRQLLACPKLIDESFPIGQGIEDILEHMEDNELEKSVIFSYFPGSFKYLKPYLESRGYAVNILKGGMGAQEVQGVVKWFDRPDKSIILNSVQFAESYDLVQAYGGYFLGASYDVEDNRQAEGRLQRLSSPRPVEIWYTRFKDTCDDRVFEILDIKSVNITHVLTSAEAAAALLQKAATRK